MKSIGVEVRGMTVCPCAAETARHMVLEAVPEIKECADKVPMVSHNQRNRTTLTVEVPEHVDVEADDLVEIVESSLSSPTYGILKRKDEANVVLRAHSNPKFVEDCVRTMAQKLVDAFSDLPDDAAVTLKQINEESIHQHNAFAERTAKMGELRAELARIKGTDE